MPIIGPPIDSPDPPPQGPVAGLPADEAEDIEETEFPDGLYEDDVKAPEDVDYTVYSIHKEHYSDTGLRQAATYGANSVIIRLHGGAESMVVYWLAQCRFGPPTVPSPTLFDSNATFLYGARCGLSPMLLPSLVAHSWKLWGAYYYALKTPVGLTSDFYLGAMPFDTMPVQDTGGPEATVPNFTMPSKNFVTGLIDADPIPKPPTSRVGKTL